MSDFLSFEKMKIEGGERNSRTVYDCQIKSLLNGEIVELTAKVELPYSDKKISEIQQDIASAIHAATNPARLRRSP